MRFHKKKGIARRGGKIGRAIFVAVRTNFYILRRRMYVVGSGEDVIKRFCEKLRRVMRDFYPHSVIGDGRWRLLKCFFDGYFNRSLNG